jgi:hypothetical protein
LILDWEVGFYVESFWAGSPGLSCYKSKWLILDWLMQFLSGMLIEWQLFRFSQK